MASRFWGNTDRFDELDRRGNGLRVGCSACAHQVDLSGGVLVKRFGGDRTLEDIYPRLICSACGAGRPTAACVGMTRHPGPR